MSKYREKRGDRRDGVLLKKLDPMHAIVPYLYVNRTDNEAFISERIDLEAINRFLAEKNKDNPEEPYKLFHIILAVIVKVLTLRPQMNRFVKGYRLYQRKFMALAFTIKKQFKDDSDEALAFINFDEDTTLDVVKDKVYAEIKSCRSDKADLTTANMDMFTKIPRFLLRIAMWVIRKLDFYGRVPYGLIAKDPNHASCYVTNLGSIKLKAGYHHLSNWGTNSIFVIIGEKKKTPVYDEEGNMQMKETIDIGLTLDERIADGYYYSKTVKLIKYLMQNPQLLELPAKQEVDYE